MKHISTLISLTFLLITNAVTLGQSQNELLYLQGNYDQILEESKSLNDSTEIFWNALVQDKLGNTLLSIDILSEGLESQSNNSRMEILLSDFLFKTGQYASAKPILLKYKEYPDSFLKLLRVLEFESDNQAAIDLLEERLETDSANIEYLARLGDNYLEINYILNAKAAFEKVIALNSKDIVALGKLANIHLKITMGEKTAIKYCDQALALDSTNRTIIKIKGLAAFRIGDFEIAEESFNYLFEHGDSSIVTLKHLGISEVKNYAFANSREHLLLAHEQDSADYEICYFLGRGYLNSRTPGKGLDYLELADSLIQPRPAILGAIIIEKASIYNTLKLYDEELEAYKLALKINPKTEYLYFMASIYHHRLHDNKMALEYYEKFLAELPPPPNGRQGTQKEMQSISLKRVAEKSLEEIKEELFFSGELKNDKIEN
jgi:tetratricopeptide (TPR) repeat protein